MMQIPLGKQQNHQYKTYKRLHHTVLNQPSLSQRLLQYFSVLWIKLCMAQVAPFAEVQVFHK